jgi:acid phosphatase (class A)
VRPLRPLFLLALALVLDPLAGGAEDAKPAASPTGYLSAQDIDGVALLGPPPAPASPKGRADRAYFDRTRALAGSARWKLAAQDADLRTGAVHRFSCAIGVDLSPATTPATSAMLRRIGVDVATLGNPPKERYNRPRPIIGNSKPVCVKREDWMRTNASYPSGHAMIGWSWALILSELLPARTDVLLHSGREFGQSRAICGVHYESDVEAGQVLASAMVARLHASPLFQADLAAARAELATATAQPADCEAYSEAAGLMK